MSIRQGYPKVEDVLKYSAFITISCYIGGMILIGAVAGIIVTLFVPHGFEWNAFTTAFLCVFLSGLVSIGSAGLLKRKNANDVINVLFCTLIRTALIGTAIVIVVITQSKNFAFYMLCFSIFFYLGMVSLNTWLILPAKNPVIRKELKTGSSRDEFNGYP